MGFKRRLQKWNQKAGGLFLPEELAVQEKACFRERVRLAEGCLAVYEYPAKDDGTPLREKGRCLVLQENLIVNLGRASLAALQRGTFDGGGAFGTMDLGYLGIGNGSGGGGTVPAPGNTAMTAELTGAGVPGPGGIVRPSVVCTTPPPGPPYMTNLWSAQIGTAELNGFSLDEAALFCLDNATMFSFRTFTAQAKAAGFVMEFRWTIIF
jgi:hypothetical protein